MKKHIIVVVALFAFIVIAGFAGYKHAQAMSNGAPALMCTQCHQDAKNRPADFVIEGLPQKYEPGKTYQITIKITKGPQCNPTVACGGFAVKVSAGQLIVTDSKDTFIANLPTGKLLTHTKQGSKKREWSFEWKAPNTPQPVTFEISVIAANGDGSNVGDAFAHKTITIEPATGAATTTTTTTPKPIVTTTTKIVESTTTKIVPGSSTTIVKTTHNTALAITVAVLLFIIGAAAYLLATRK